MSNLGEMLLSGPPSGDDAYTDEDAQFVLEYIRLRNQGDSAAHVTAFINAKIHKPSMTTVAGALWQLNRPVIRAAIKAATETKSKQSVLLEPTGEVSVQSITAHAENIREKATNDRQYATALNAVKLTAQLHGLLEQTINVNHSMKAAEMTTAELTRIASAGRRAIEGEFTDVTPEPVAGLSSAANK